MLHKWNLDDPKAAHETRESRADTMDTLFSLTVFESVRARSDVHRPLGVWRDYENAVILSVVKTV